MRLWRRYSAFAEVALQSRLAYRRAFLLSAAGQVITVLSLFYLWRALFAGRLELAGFSWDEMKTYLLLVFFSGSLVGWLSEIGIVYRIVEGEVAIDLLKPVDYQGARFVEALGASLLEGLVALVLVAALAVFFGGMHAPPDATHGILAAVSFALSIPIKYGLVYLSALVCFWVQSGWGVAWARNAVTSLFSGMLVPLPFLPHWLQTAAEWLPFQGTLFVPVTIYLGRLDTPAALQALAVQAAWAAGLWFAGRAGWSVVVRKVTIHGG